MGAEGMKKEAAAANEMKYAKHIISQSALNMPELDFMRTRILLSGDEIIPDALCVNCAWYALCSQ
jgi:hypothetical protein